MTDNFVAVERRLIMGYQAQLRHYDQALHLLVPPAPEAEEPARPDHCAGSLSAGSRESVRRVQALNAILLDIAGLDAALAEDKTVWRFSGRQASPHLREIVEEVTNRIRALAAIVDRRVTDLQACMKTLLPEVDECIQQRRMLNAYGKSS